MRITVVSARLPIWMWCFRNAEVPFLSLAEASLFKLDNSKQKAALETARRQIAEIDAAMVSARTDVARTEAQIEEAKSAHKQALDELKVKSDLQQRNPGIVPQRDIEKLQVTVDGRQATVDAAVATKQSAEAKVSTLLPHKRQAPRPRSRKRKSNMTRPSSALPSPGASSNLLSAWAISSIP